MRLAITRRPRGDEDQGAVFIDVVAFDGLAVACASALGKGSKVLIDGRLEHRAWQARDGSKRSRHEVIAQEVVFLDTPTAPANGRRERRSESPTSASPRSAPALAAA